MDHAINWCAHNRPELGNWMTLDRFQDLMNRVAQATWGMNGGKDWTDQTAFLRSEDGAEYYRRLDQSLKAFVQLLHRG
jgi:hypothetical protein